MKSMLILLFVFLLLLNTTIASVEVGDEDKGDEGVIIGIPIPPVNYTIRNTNRSDFWDNLDTPLDFTNIEASSSITTPIIYFDNLLNNLWDDGNDMRISGHDSVIIGVGVGAATYTFTNTELDLGNDNLITTGYVNVTDIIATNDLIAYDDLIVKDDIIMSGGINGMGIDTSGGSSVILSTSTDTWQLASAAPVGWSISSPVVGGKTLSVTGDCAVDQDVAKSSDVIHDDMNLTGDLVVAGKVGIGTVAPAVALHVAGTTATDIIRADNGLDFNPVGYPSAATATAVAGSGLEIGDYYYFTTYYTALGETDIRTFVAKAVTTAGNQQVDITNLGVSTDYRVVGRKIYRGNVDEKYYAYLLTTIENNVDTTYTDTTADGDLGTTNNYFRVDTTCNYITSDGYRALVVDANLLALGKYAGSSLTTGGRNTFVGSSAGKAVTTGNDNVIIGHKCAGSLISGHNSVIIGVYSGSKQTGGWNTIVGAYSGYANTDGNYNTALGYGAMRGTTGVGTSYNTALGYYAGYAMAGDNNVFLGYRAGRWETGSDKLFIDAISRANEADARVKALIYGEFDADPTNQNLTFNANVEISENLKGTDADFSSSVNATSFLIDGAGSHGVYEIAGNVRIGYDSGTYFDIRNIQTYFKLDGVWHTQWTSTDLSPYSTNAIDLGTDAKRWQDFYTIDGDFSGDINLTGLPSKATTATSQYVCWDTDGHLFLNETGC